MPSSSSPAGIAGLALALIAVACSAPAPLIPRADPTDAPSPPATPESSPLTPSSRGQVPTRAATVQRVIDGDTIDVRIGSRRERVRLIGIDTPERGQRYAAEATAFTRARIGPGTIVHLELDVEERDRFGRLLAYVWHSPPSSRSPEAVRDGMHNAAVLSAGLAVVLTIPPNVRYADLFIALQRRAREQRRGLWTPRPAGARCDPAYPDVCIPPPPPDQDCSDIEHRGFRVRGADPHRFDGDGNGRGCEG